MTTATRTPSIFRTSLVLAASTGAVAGVIASLMMAAYAMIAAATYQCSGFFTAAPPHRVGVHLSGRHDVVGEERHHG